MRSQKEMESLGIDKLCDLGDSAYYLFPDTSIRWKSNHPDGLMKMIYSETPLNRGYSEFMPHQLARAMEENGLFKDNPEIYQEAKRQPIFWIKGGNNESSANID